MAGIISLHHASMTDSSKCPFPIISWQLDVLKIARHCGVLLKSEKKERKLVLPCIRNKNAFRPHVVNNNC